MHRPTTVVITVEGLATSALSCYGSSWNATPALDALAASGCVWDRVIATSTSPHAVLDSWIGGADAAASLASFREIGSVELFTDSQQLSDVRTKAPFDRVELVVDPQRSPRTRPSESVERTRLGRLVATVTERLLQGDTPALTWLHTASLVTLWDAPRSLALIDDPEEFDESPSEEVELLVDQGSVVQPREAIPAVFSSVDVPAVRIDENAHPDLVLSWMRTYGCQVRLLDLLIGILTDFEPLADARFIVASTSGFSLGQNGWVGAVGPARSAHVRLPLVMSRHTPLRVGRLTSSDQFVRALTHASAADSQKLVSPAEWVQDQDELQPRIETVGPEGFQIVTTPRWFYVRNPEREESLFLKPDDVDDANDIARLRPDVCELLQTEHPPEGSLVP